MSQAKAALQHAPMVAAKSALALALHPNDNVATALRALDTHQSVLAQGAEQCGPVVLRDPSALCHKYALCDIAAGQAIIKYGESIGHATRAIRAGAHVHVHNLVSARAR